MEHYFYHHNLIIMLISFGAPVDVQGWLCSKAVGCSLLVDSLHPPTFVIIVVLMKLKMIKPPLIVVHRELSSLVLGEKLARAPVGRSQVSHRPDHTPDINFWIPDMESSDMYIVRFPNPLYEVSWKI